MSDQQGNALLQGSLTTRLGAPDFKAPFAAQGAEPISFCGGSRLRDPSTLAKLYAADDDPLSLTTP